MPDEKNEPPEEEVLVPDRWSEEPISTDSKEPVMENWPPKHDPGDFRSCLMALFIVFGMVALVLALAYGGCVLYLR